MQVRVHSLSASFNRSSVLMYRFCCSPGSEHSQHWVSVDSQYTSQCSQYIGGSHNGSIILSHSVLAV